MEHPVWLLSVPNAKKTALTTLVETATENAFASINIYSISKDTHLIYVYVCMYERESVCVCMRERICVYVCTRERGRERVYVCISITIMKSI